MRNPWWLPEEPLWIKVTWELPFPPLSPSLFLLLPFLFLPFRSSPARKSERALCGPPVGPRRTWLTIDACISCMFLIISSPILRTGLWTFVGVEYQFYGCVNSLGFLLFNGRPICGPPACHQWQWHHLPSQPDHHVSLSEQNRLYSSSKQ